jgi:hypothetical protein
LRAYYFFIIILTSGCLAQDDLIDFSTSQLDHLLTSDSCKSWNLKSRQVDNQQAFHECDRDDVLTICSPVTPQDTATMTLFTGPALCNHQLDTIISYGSWYISDASETPTLFYIVAEDTNIYKIDFISSQLLNMSYTLPGGQFIAEQYSWP